MSTAAGDRHFFEDIADHLGPAYLRYSFTKGTAQEVDFLMERLGLDEGSRLLDVGCGPGRHARALAEAGVIVVGIDISAPFIELARREAPATARFERMDARQLPFDQEFDAVISLCQGAFGLVGGGPGVDGSAVDPDGAVLDGMAAALVPGGVLAVSAFSAYFQVRFLEDHDHFDAAAGVNRELATLTDQHGAQIERDLWTSCFTPRELRLLVDRAGLEVDDVYGVTPGRYRADPPSLDVPEFLVVAHRPMLPPGRGRHRIGPREFRETSG
ncbi:MAG: methyltransferase domain-containing protein [Acidimicrobiia bacterium]|nr:methyltransferase domain-containing protein [Acidimicrobiia bacterium]